MGARHRRHASASTRPRPRTVEIVDVVSRMAHQLTFDAVDAARGASGRYIALCGSEVLPASLTAPPQGRCRSCIWVPVQRSVASR